MGFPADRHGKASAPKVVGVIAVAALLVFLGVRMYRRGADDPVVMYVFHAGSLAAPFSEIERVFEAEHPGVDVRREAAGSASSIRKVTELGRRCDVVASADFTLIDTMMLDASETAAGFNVQFASNGMVIAYTDMSAGGAEIDGSNWHRILERDGIRFGFSNPNDDPCGYRALMVVELASMRFGDPFLFDSLIANHTGITHRWDGGDRVITVPGTGDISPSGKISMRSAEIELMASLELGEIDYLFIYKSVAFQHRSSGVRFVELGGEVDLSSAVLAGNYSRVRVELANGDVVPAKPIVYGVTIPFCAENYALAVEFLECLLGSAGRDIMARYGQTPLVPARSDDPGSVPDELRHYLG